MHSNFYLSPLAAALSVFLISPTNAAEPINLHKSTFTAVKNHFNLALPGQKHALNASTNALKVEKQRTDKNNVTHVRMQQYYSGYPVFGGYAITHSSYSPKALLKADSGIKMNGTVFKGLESELGRPSASFIKNKNTALSSFLSTYKGEKLSEKQVIPMVYIDKNHKAHWAYQVSVFITYDDKIPARPSAIIDAETYKPFVKWNDVKAARSPV